MNRLLLERVQYLPRDLSPGILYVSVEYSVAGHLCACGCGNKVITPLGPAEWDFFERSGQPSLRPSIGNWQLPCRSHYFISAGRILWAGEMSEAAIQAGRRAEEHRRQTHYASRNVERSWWGRLWRAIRSLFGFS